MSIFSNFAIGFLAALIGVIPPGLLNMSAAKISMKQGRKSALLFSVGVCITVCVQTYIALIFARYLDRHPEVIDMLQKVALGIFICLTLYFFFLAKDPRADFSHKVDRSHTNRFFYGIFLATLNLLPLPYWVYISITFSAFGWFSFENMPMAFAIIASGMGTFVMLFIYAQYFRKKNGKNMLGVNVNYVIGLITAIISAITLFKIMQDF